MLVAACILWFISRRLHRRHHPLRSKKCHTKKKNPWFGGLSPAARTARGGRRAAVHSTTWVHARLYPRMDRCERLERRHHGSREQSPKAAAHDEAVFVGHSRWPRRKKRQRAHSQRTKGRATFRHLSAFKQFGMGAYGDVGRQRWSAREKLHQQLASLRPFRFRGTIGGVRTTGATTARVTMLMAHPALVASASIT